MNAGYTITMRDVAHATGVSRATVSLALRHHPGIPESTRARVRQAADALGYRPDPLVATLMARLHGKRTSSETPTLAVLNYSTEHPHSLDAFGQFQKGAAARADALGFRLESFPCNTPGMTSERLDKILKSRNISGVLLPPLVTHNRALSLEWSRYAVAGLATRQGDVEVDRVGADHFGNATLALARLAGLGYSRIGFTLPADVNEWVQKKWLAAYLIYQQTVPGRQRIQPYLPKACNFTGFKAWYEMSHPDAILFLSGSVRDYTARLKLRTNEDLALASLNTLASQDLGGIDENGDAIGAAAVDLVVSRIHRNDRGVPGHPKTVLIRGTWHPGKTVAPQPAKESGQG